MALTNKPLVTDAMRRFRQTLGTRLSSEQARAAIRQRFVSARTDSPAKRGLSQDQVGTESGLNPEQRIVLVQMSDEREIAALMEWVGRSNRSKFREVVLAPLLALDLVEMAIADKPNSSKQRYRLTQQGKTLRDEMGE